MGMEKRTREESHLGKSSTDLSAEEWLKLVEDHDYKALKLENGDGEPLWLDEVDGVYRMGASHVPRVRTASGLGLEREDLVDHIEKCDIEAREVPRTYAINRAMVAEDSDLNP